MDRRPAGTARPRSPSRSTTTEPTDRSMPPTISRIVMPTTTMPSTEKAISMARKLSQVRKYGEAKLMAMHSARMMSDQPGLAHRDEPRRAKSPRRRAVAVISACMAPVPASLGDMLGLPLRVVRPTPEASRMMASSVMFVAVDFAGDPALADHQHAVAEADQFRQFRRDDDDADAAARRARAGGGGSRPWRRRRRRASARP